MGITPLRLQPYILNISGTMAIIMRKVLAMALAVNTINPEVLISLPRFWKGMRRKMEK